MSAIGRDALLAGFLPQEDVELPSGAGVVRVRGMTRWEAVELSKSIEAGELTAADGEIVACAHGMLDPAMTRDDVIAWRRATVAADVQAVAGAIGRLSNLDDAAGKGPTSTSRRTRR